MNLLKNAKIKTKLICTFLIIVILISGIGAVGTISLKKVAKNSKNMYDDNMQRIYIMTNIRKKLMQINNDLLQLIYINDFSKKADIEKNIQVNEDTNNKYIVIYEKFSMNDTQKQNYLLFEKKLKEYME